MSNFFSALRHYYIVLLGKFFMNQQLKIDFHIHTYEDTDNYIDYNAYDLIDRAVILSFDAIAITNHDMIIYDSKLAAYAEKRGILLFPGVERSIDHKHLLLINFSDIDSLDTYDAIQHAKNDNNLVIAPHPFFPGMQSLGKDMYFHPGLFDAIEYCHFYNHRLNFNREAMRFAKAYGLPLIAGSDAHTQEQFGRCYSLVNSDKNRYAIIQAIKKGHVQVVAPPLTLAKMIRIYLKILSNKPNLKRAFVRIQGIINRLRYLSETKKYLQ
jgi:hypothetical protein